jgi:hypothetical protein
MLPKDFVLFIEGYNHRVLTQHDIARRQAYFEIAPHLKQGVTMQQFFRDSWPLPTDKLKISESLREKYERLKNGRRS